MLVEGALFKGTLVKGMLVNGTLVKGTLVEGTLFEGTTYPGSKTAGRTAFSPHNILFATHSIEFPSKEKVSGLIRTSVSTQISDRWRRQHFRI